MKYSGFLFLCLLLSSIGFTQVKLVGVQAVFATDREGRGIIANARQVQGTPFATTEWKAGTIIFSNGLKGADDFLNFDLYSNKPAFLQGENYFHFKDPVKEIRYTVDINGEPKTYLFRNEYPAVGKQDRTFYYRVEEEGPNFHLLQLLEKLVGEEMVSIGVYDKRFIDQQEWYLYDAKAAKLVKMPKSKKELVSLAAGLSPSLSNYLKTAQSVNLKNETELKKMVHDLNQ
ncbi:hypothetical protein [Flavihumibacter sp. CACIAM 22H1]|uniref:hypothetical protein n=1 Tax=Flavihumibacter sp. CACIAM 22H1 TaxID=1812911 RepID=UPI0007A862FF|nr:hypothetical protein [Flavihumibacter sp. CACIAM 22H1]KYP12902.1 MAG: hypothetical protein A1D16_03235 [Flavihumibacter sp. CACIAM 22H1]